ncbi:MAG: glycosyltransferase [Xanthomonadales bacterium]|nr:glycosyltransferase [Xanthomonadales bacterium]
MFDVVLPVHDAREALARCLASLEPRLPREAGVIVVDDASRDPAVPPLLRDFVARDPDRRRLLVNPQNRGFVHSVNRGMAASGRDVVLLNSDTVLTRGWLERLRACLDADPSIATATPWSNNATICSLPRFLEPNPEPEDPESWAAAARAKGSAALPRDPDRGRLLHGDPPPGARGARGLRRGDLRARLRRGERLLHARPRLRLAQRALRRRLRGAPGRRLLRRDRRGARRRGARASERALPALPAAGRRVHRRRSAAAAARGGGRGALPASAAEAGLASGGRLPPEARRESRRPQGGAWAYTASVPAEPAMSEPILPFTGERFTPECVREIWYEHWHRYAFAASLAVGPPRARRRLRRRLRQRPARAAGGERARRGPLRGDHRPCPGPLRRTCPTSASRWPTSPPCPRPSAAST